MERIERVKLFVNHNPKSERIANKVKESLAKKGFELVEHNYQLGIAIGGDGSFLRMIKKAGFNKDVFYVGINAGTLGFAQDVSEKEIDYFLNCIKKNEFTYEDISIGEVKVTTKDKEEQLKFLNEVVIREEAINTFELNVLVDKVLLEKYVGDGLCISTSFGSTAYNLSFGGSIVDNAFHTLQITPVAPLNNKSYRNLLNPVIIPSNKSINLEPQRNSKNIMLTIDGDNITFQDVSKIDISIYKETMKVIRKKNYNFIEKINDKFLK